MHLDERTDRLLRTIRKSCSAFRPSALPVPFPCHRARKRNSSPDLSAEMRGFLRRGWAYLPTRLAELASSVRYARQRATQRHEIPDVVAGRQSRAAHHPRVVVKGGERCVQHTASVIDSPTSSGIEIAVFLHPLSCDPGHTPVPKTGRERLLGARHARARRVAWCLNGRCSNSRQLDADAACVHQEFAFASPPFTCSRSEVAGRPGDR
jgi:hypothetical protein